MDCCLAYTGSANNSSPIAAPCVVNRLETGRQLCAKCEEVSCTTFNVALTDL